MKPQSWVLRVFKNSLGKLWALLAILAIRENASHSWIRLATMSSSFFQHRSRGLSREFFKVICQSLVILA